MVKKLARIIEIALKTVTTALNREDWDEAGDYEHEIANIVVSFTEVVRAMEREDPVAVTVAAVSLGISLDAALRHEYRLLDEQPRGKEDQVRENLLLGPKARKSHAAVRRESLRIEAIDALTRVRAELFEHGDRKPKETNVKKEAAKALQIQLAALYKRLQN